MNNDKQYIYYKEKFCDWLENQNTEYPSSGHLDDIFDISIIDSKILNYSFRLLSEYRNKIINNKVLTFCIYLKEVKKPVENISKLEMKMLSCEPPEFVFQNKKDIPEKEIFIEDFPYELKSYLGTVFDKEDKIYYPYIVII